MNVGDLRTNKQLIEAFGCAQEGRMRKVNRLATLLLFGAPPPYLTRREGEMLHYPGAGRSGDQKLSDGENLVLYHARRNGVRILLFDVAGQAGFRYAGSAELAADPYQELQPDDSGRLRRVWMFPLTFDRSPAGRSLD